MKKSIIATAIVSAIAFSNIANADDLDASLDQLNSNNYVHADAFAIYASIPGVTDEIKSIDAIASATGNIISIQFDGPAVNENSSSLSSVQNNGTDGPTLQYSTSHVLHSSAGTEGTSAIEAVPGTEATEGVPAHKGYFGGHGILELLNPDNWKWVEATEGTPAIPGIEAVPAVPPIVADINAAAFSKGNAFVVTATDTSTHEFEDFQITQTNGVELEDGAKDSAQNAYSTIYNSQATGDINSAAVALGNSVDIVLNNQLGDQGSEEADTIDQKNLSAAQYAESWISSGQAGNPTVAGGDLTSVARAVGNDIKVIAIPDDEPGTGLDSHELENITQLDKDSFQSASSFVGGYPDTESVEVNYYSVDIDDIHYNSGNHDADTGQVIVAGDSSSVATATGNSLVIIGDAIRQSGEASISWSQTAEGQGVGDYYHNVPGSESDSGFENVDQIAEYITVEDFGVGESALAVTQNALVGGDAVTYADAVANSLVLTGVEAESGEFAIGGNIDVHDIDQSNSNNVEIGVALSLNNEVGGDLTTVARAAGNRATLVADIIDLEGNATGTIAQVNTDSLQLSHAFSTGNLVGNDLTTSSQSIGNAINITANAVTGAPALTQTNINASQYSVAFSVSDVAGGDLTSNASAIGNSIAFSSLANLAQP